MRVNHFLTGEIGLLQKTGRAVISPAVYLGGKSSPCHRTKEANRVLSVLSPFPLGPNVNK